MSLVPERPQMADDVERARVLAQDRGEPMGDRRSAVTWTQAGRSVQVGPNRLAVEGP
jgi:hypothetical protein